MALVNGLNGMLKSGGSQNLGSLLHGSTKTPIIDRYHSSGEEYHGWMKSKPKKNNVALSALTLLAFLFFLNILQNCLQDHMDEMKGKGKGMMMMESPLTQMQMVMNAAGREDVSKKGDLGDNSLEIDDFTIQAEDRQDGGKKKRRKNGQGKRNKNKNKKDNQNGGNLKGNVDKVLEKINTINV